jgi:hypothetical protein
MDDKKILALAKKNAAKAAKVEKKRQRSYDDTLDATKPVDAEEGSDADEIFREMKKRTF